MDLLDKLSMYLIGEAVAVKMTPYGKSYIKLQDKYTKEELDQLVDKMASKAGDYKYEVSFGKGSDRDKLVIYRKSQIKRGMSPDETKAFRQEITNLIKGTGLRVVGDTKSADWAAVFVSK